MEEVPKKSGAPNPAPLKEPHHTLRLVPLTKYCPECGHTLWNLYDTHRTVTTLEGVVQLVLCVRHCCNHSCSRFHKPYRLTRVKRFKRFSAP
jgi:hypothetical protein